MARNRGFTIIELLVVTVVFVVLLVAGLPSFTEFVRNQRIKTASFDLFSTLVHARSEAITRNASVTIAPIGGNWANGWNVTDADGIVIRAQDALPSVTITSGATSVVYRGSGRLDASVLPAFELSSVGDSILTRCIRVDLSGRPYTKAESC